MVARFVVAVEVGEELGLLELRQGWWLMYRGSQRRMGKKGASG